jgi:hypothetical protein
VNYEEKANTVLLAIRAAEGRCWLHELFDALSDQGWPDGHVVVGRMVAEGRLAVVPTHCDGLGVMARDA